MKFKLIKDKNTKNINLTQKELNRNLKCFKKIVTKFLGFTLVISIILPPLMYNTVDFITTLIIPEERQEFVYLTKERFHKEEVPYERNELVKEAQVIFENNFDKRLLQNFYSNIGDFKYHFNPNDLKKDNLVEAYYDYTANRIVEIQYENDCFLHEIIHLATSDKTNCGLKKKSLGVGINEGYTEFFKQKYFSTLINNPNVIYYENQTIFADLLASTIEIDKMNEAFLTANQDMLVDELIKLYGTKEDAYELLKSIDEINIKKTEKENQNASKLAFGKFLNYSLGKIIKDIDFSDDGHNKSRDVAYYYVKLLSCGHNFNITHIETDEMLHEKVINYCLEETDKYKYSNSKTLSNFIQNYVMDYKEYGEDTYQKVKK